MSYTRHAAWAALGLTSSGLGLVLFSADRWTWAVVTVLGLSVATHAFFLGVERAVASGRGRIEE